MTILTERCRNDIRKALNNYYFRVNQARKRLEQVRTEYGEEAESRERERIESQLKSARNQAEAEIDQAHREAVEFTTKWGQLDGAKLTEDAKLLEHGLVDPAQFNVLKEKYSNNATMLTALKKYGDQENEKLFQQAQKTGKTVENIFLVKDIPTANDRIENWNKLHQSAVNHLDRIDGSGQYADSWTQSIANAFDSEGRITIQTEIDSLGEGVDL